MADIQQQIADGARPRLARVGDRIEHGETIPANVVKVRDAGGDRWHRFSESGFRTTRTALSIGAVESWWPMTVVEVDPEPQPAEPTPLHRYEPAPGMVCRVCGGNVMDDIHPDVQREQRCPDREPHEPHTHNGFARPEGVPSPWCPGRRPAPEPERDVEDDVHYYVSELRPGTTFCGIGLEEDNDLSTTDVAGKATCDTCRAEADEDALGACDADGVLRLKGTATGDNQLDPEPCGDVVACQDALYLARKSRDEHHNRLEAVKGELANAGYADPNVEAIWIGNDVHRLVQRCLAAEAEVQRLLARAPEQPADPGPLVLTLPVVPDGAAALVDVNGRRWVRSFVAVDGEERWDTNGPFGARVLGELLTEFRPLTVEMAPPREPRTWPRFDGLPDDVKCVEVNGIQYRRGSLGYWVSQTGHPDKHTSAELHLMGEVREVLGNG